MHIIYGKVYSLLKLTTKSAPFVFSTEKKCKLKEMPPLVHIEVIFSEWNILEEHTPFFSQICLLLCVWRWFESRKSSGFKIFGMAI